MSLFSNTATTAPADLQVVSPPDDTVSCMKFSPGVLQETFLAAGSWDGIVRCWAVDPHSRQTMAKASQNHTAPILSLDWSDDGSKVFVAGCDKTAKMWDLQANQYTQVAAHNDVVRTVHFVKGANYSCLLTGSWDKTLKFWDLRSPTPMATMQLEERVYCADVFYPMAVVGLANRSVNIYNLDPQPAEFRKIQTSEAQLKYQYRCLSIFADKTNLKAPVGFAVGSLEGRVSVTHAAPDKSTSNFTFKCHRSSLPTGGTSQDVYPVHSISFHPQHMTLATAGGDGKFCFWDKDARIKLKTSDAMDQPITATAIDARGQVFAYALGYDWCKGHEGVDASKKPRIMLKACAEEMKPNAKK